MIKKFFLQRNGMKNLLTSNYYEESMTLNLAADAPLLLAFANLPDPRKFRNQIDPLNDLILGQLKTAEKSNEITALPELLNTSFPVKIAPRFCQEGQCSGLSKFLVVASLSL